MAHDVFISYSSRDKATADAVCGVLEAGGVKCWIAPRDILGGMEYAEAIVEAIEQSRVMVLVFSSGANQSPHISREVERAVNKAVTIIPLRVEDVTPTSSLEYFITATQWQDALTPPLQKHLYKLADTVERVLARPDKRADRQRPAAPAAAVPQGQQPAAWHRQQADGHLKRGEHDAAVAAYAQSVDLEPAAAAYYGRAEAYARKGEYDFAIADYSEAARRLAKAGGAASGPLLSDALCGRAGAHAARGDFAAAIADYDRAVDVDPDLALAYVGRGDANLRRSHVNDAIADYTVGLRLNPRLAHAYVQRAESCLRRGRADMGDHDTPFADAAAAIRIDPKLARAYRARGEAFLKKGDLDRAMADVTMAVTLKPDYGEAYGTRGRVYAAQFDTGKAVADFNEALRLNPSLAAAYLDRGTAYAASHEYTRAIGDFTEAVRFVDANSTAARAALARRGAAYLAVGDADRAVADLEQVGGSTGPDSGEPWADLARAYAMKGDYAKAVDRWGYVVGCYDRDQYKPQWARALQGRAAAHAKAGDPDSAKADYEKAMELDPTIASPAEAAGMRADLDRAIADKKAAEERAAREHADRVRALAEAIGEDFRPTAADSWLDVVAKATALRRAGRLDEAVKAWELYAVLFAGTTAPGDDFVRAAVRFARQAGDVGVDGGMYLYETSRGYYFNDTYLGLILTRYDNRPVRTQEELADAQRSGQEGSPVTVEWLYLNDKGRFERVTRNIPGGPTGAAFIAV